MKKHANRYLNLLSSKKVFAVGGLLCVLFACSKNSMDKPASNVCSGASKSFAADVNPIIQAKCIGCHGVGSNNGPGALLTYSEIFNAREEIRSAVASGLMPLNGTLTAAEKNSILCWIDNGATNN